MLVSRARIVRFDRCDRPRRLHVDGSVIKVGEACRGNPTYCDFVTPSHYDGLTG